MSRTFYAVIVAVNERFRFFLKEKSYYVRLFTIMIKYFKKCIRSATIKFQSYFGYVSVD